jgi:ferredoxin--NADP+ reductase
VHNNFTTTTIAYLKRTDSKAFTLGVHKTALEFEAGQFTRLALDLDGEVITRPYSFSSHKKDMFFEFYITPIENGKLSPQINSLKPGDKIKIAKTSNGHITPASIPKSKYLWFFVTGTGVGLAQSLIRDKAILKNHEKIIIVHGVRTEADIIQPQELSLKENISYLACISQPSKKTLYEGRIWENIKDITLNNKNDLSPVNSYVVLCGNPDMIKEGKTLFEARGFSLQKGETKGNLIHERYW